MTEDILRERLRQKNHTLFNGDDGGWWLIRNGSSMSRHFGNDNWCSLLDIAWRLGAATRDELCHVEGL